MKCDWIIFYSEASGRHGCVPFKSKAANHTRGKAKGMFSGTLNEANEECKRRDREAGLTGIFKRRYTPKEKPVREHRQSNKPRVKAERI